MATATFWFTQIMTLPVFHAFCYITQTIEALSLITYFTTTTSITRDSRWFAI